MDSRTFTRKGETKETFKTERRRKEEKIIFGKIAYCFFFPYNTTTTTKIYINIIQNLLDFNNFIKHSSVLSL